MYTPGMLTDVVREVREAARIREEALLNRVKALVDERSWSLNETNIRFMREIEELKLQVHQLKSERKESNQKLIQMDTEIKTLKSLLTQTINFSRMNASMQQHQPFQNDFINRQQPIPRTPSKRNNVNLNYGTVQHEDGIHLHTVKENEMNLNNSGNNNNISGNSEITSQGSPVNYGYQNDSKYSSPDQKSSSNKSFGSDGQLLQLEKDNLALRRELQNARASSSNSENRIKA